MLERRLKLRLKGNIAVLQFRVKIYLLKTELRIMETKIMRILLLVNTAL